MTGGLNLSAYTPNPLRFIDPLGLDPGSCESNQTRKEACYQKCIRDTYGASWDIAGYLNPLSGLFSISTTAATSALSDEAESLGERAAITASYEDVNGYGSAFYKTGTSAARMTRLLGVLRFVSNASAVLAVGAFSFQVTAYAYCSDQCSN